MKNIYEVDNFNNLKKSPVIFFRYTIQMLTFLIAIYLVHLNFSLLNALFALVMLIVSEMVLEIIENIKWGNKSKKTSLLQKLGKYIDNNFHFVILLIAFCIRIIILYKFGMIQKESIEIWSSILNCAFGAVISLFIYLLSKELFSKRTGQIVAILYSANIFATMYANVFTKYNLFAVLILLSMYLIIAKKYMKMNYMLKYAIVSVIICIASIIRIEAVIYLIAIIVYLFSNSLIKDKNRKEKIVSICIILVIYLIVNGIVLILNTLDVTQYNSIESFRAYKEMFEGTEKSVKQFEVNSKRFWGEIDYTFTNKIKSEKINTYDSSVFLFSVISSAIIIIYCKMKNVEDERMYLLYIIILVNFFIYGFVKDNNYYSYVSKIIMYVLASGGLAIFKKNAEMEAMEKYNVKLLQE